LRFVFRLGGFEVVALKAENVSMSYGSLASRREVLKDFSLEVEEAGFVALMGPSGSGKSTLLHLSAGLLLPDSGRIEVGGVEISSMGDAAAARFRRRHEGVVFQAYNLVESLTVAENVSLPAKLDHRKVDEKRVNELLDSLGLSGRGGESVLSLSGGERQRVAVARALYMKPRIIFADEPTGNLDAKSARELCGIFKGLNVREKTAILMVTHDPVVASVADKVCFLGDGRVLSSHDTKHDPANVSSLYLEAFG
jgi:putative ABC transport system ATP-binding protein